MGLKNRKVVVLNGLARGGTNIVWNILQSHPTVCSPIYETGQILYSEKNPYLPIDRILKSKLVTVPFISKIISYIVDKIFYESKLQNLTHSDNKFKFKDILYTKNEIENSVLCLKSINDDIELTKALSIFYKECFFIGLIRNGYAIAESWIRRGCSPKKIGYIYREYGERIIEGSKIYEHYNLVRFEDILKDPFSEASKLYQFARLEPSNLKMLRLKVKRVLSEDGKYEEKFGEVNQKYWVNLQDIQKIISPDISDIQARAVSPSDRKIFEKEAGWVLGYFGYTLK